MFESLSDRLGGIFEGLTRRGALSDKDVSAALREVRRALIEADVALDVVRDFTDRVREKAVGAEVVRSIKPGQMVVKIVHDELIAMLGSDAQPIDLNAPAPVVIMMVGLQGSGKTTTSAKIAKRLAEKSRKKVLMASLDTRRPAAQEQLRQLGEQTGIDTLPVIPGQTPVDIAARAVQAGRLGGYDAVILDTAGRTHIDEPLMVEMADIKAKARPHEILLVADSLTGQDAVNLAQNFDSRVGISGIVLTRIDGDGRGGAALSMRAVTGKPIKLIGTGEKMDALEDFHPARIADRILGMGDIVSLVEKAAENIDAEKAAAMTKRMQKGEFHLNDLSDQLKLIGTGEKMDALEDFHPARIADRILGMGDIVSLVEKAAENIDAEKAAAMAKRMQKGEFDLNDLSDQLKQMQNLGGMGGIMGMLPGIGKMKKQMDAAGIDDSVFKRQQAIISSMTRQERKSPKLLNANRKKRVAAGSGTSVQEINKLLKMHLQMSDMMKKMGKGGMKGLMGSLGGMMGGGGMMGKMMGGMGGMPGGMGGMPDLSKMDPKELERMAREMGMGGGGMPKLPGLPGAGGFPGLPGIGKKK